MPEYKLRVNGRVVPVDVDDDTPLLWVLRDELALTATKFGCGIGQCYACAVHLDGAVVPSCQMPVSQIADREITTREGLDSEQAARLERAWIDLDVPQCGYCQSGQIMTAAALLAQTPQPTDEEINARMSTNLCRCGTYNRIRAAIHRAAGEENDD